MNVEKVSLYIQKYQSFSKFHKIIEILKFGKILNIDKNEATIIITELLPNSTFPKEFICNFKNIELKREFYTFQIVDGNLNKPIQDRQNIYVVNQDENEYTLVNLTKNLVKKIFLFIKLLRK